MTHVHTRERHENKTRVSGLPMVICYIFLSCGILKSHFGQRNINSVILKCIHLIYKKKETR